MHTNNIIKFLSILAQNPSAYCIPDSQAALISKETVILALDDESNIIDFGLSFKVSSSIAVTKTSPKNIYVMASFKNDGFIVNEPFAALSKQFGFNLLQYLAINNMSKSKFYREVSLSSRRSEVPPKSQEQSELPIGLENLFKMLEKKLNESGSKQPENKETHEMHTFPEFLSEVFGDKDIEFPGILSQLLSTCGDPECQGCMGKEEEHEEAQGEMKNKERPPIDWDKPLFNALGKVRYKQREGDQEKGYRQIKFNQDGFVMSYPVDSITGEPLMTGVDNDIYTVDNEVLEDESQEEDPTKTALETMLSEMLPENSNEIKEFLAKVQ
jgi:hypothetical protein